MRSSVMLTSILHRTRRLRLFATNPNSSPPRRPAMLPWSTQPPQSPSVWLFQLSIESGSWIASRQAAKNAEVAAEFGMSLRQVQGLRMGCAREIARRRDQLGNGSALEPTSLATSVEEIVRYLRQQDEVVVLQPNGDFLLNGRFNLTLADLLARANRMRGRQHKPSFELLGGMPAGEKIRQRTDI